MPEEIWSTLRTLFSRRLDGAPVAPLEELRSGALQDMVAVGATDHRSVRIWVRAERPGRHLLRIWKIDAPPTVTGEVLAAPDDAIEAPFEVPDDPLLDGTTSLCWPDDPRAGGELDPMRFYAFDVRREGGGSLGAGWFQTSPSGLQDMPDRVAFAFLSCHQPFLNDGSVSTRSLKSLHVLDEAFQRFDVKRVLLLGDQVYSDWPERFSLFEEEHFRRVAPPGRESILDCTREEVRRLYHERYRVFWKVGSWRRFQARWPCYPMLDDHEVADDFGSHLAHSTERWGALRAGALDAYWDYQAIRVRPRPEERPGSSHYGFDYGTVGFFLLDLRSDRRRRGGDVRVVSDAQWDELDQWLAAHGEHEVVVLSLSVPLVHAPDWIVDTASALNGADGEEADRWGFSGTRDDRSRLIRTLVRHQVAHPDQRLLLLGGDVHVGVVSELTWRAGGPSAIQAVSSAVSNLENPLMRHANKLMPGMNRTLRWGEGGAAVEARLLPGEEGATGNPWPQLNAGIVEVQRGAPRAKLRVRLVSHDDGAPPEPVVVYDSGWI